MKEQTDQVNSIVEGLYSERHLPDDTMFGPVYLEEMGQ